MARSTFQILSDAVGEGRDFFKVLAALARAEFQDQAARAARGAALGIGALIFFLFALVFLLLGLAAAIMAYGLPPFAAFLAVGGLAILVSALSGLGAFFTLSKLHLSPSRTLDQIRRLSASRREPPYDASAPQ